MKKIIILLLFSFAASYMLTACQEEKKQTTFQYGVVDRIKQFSEPVTSFIQREYGEKTWTLTVLKLGFDLALLRWVVFPPEVLSQFSFRHEPVDENSQAARLIHT